MRWRLKRWCTYVAVYNQKNRCLIGVSMFYYQNVFSCFNRATYILSQHRIFQVSQLHDAICSLKKTVRVHCSFSIQYCGLCLLIGKKSTRIWWKYSSSISNHHRLQKHRINQSGISLSKSDCRWCKNCWFSWFHITNVAVEC